MVIVPHVNYAGTETTIITLRWVTGKGEKFDHYAFYTCGPNVHQKMFIYT